MWSSNIFLYKEAILNNPLWFNSEFPFPLRRDWLNKGITIDLDLSTDTRVMLSQEELEFTCQVKINFIDYFNISNEITD